MIPDRNQEVNGHGRCSGSQECGLAQTGLHWVQFPLPVSERTVLITQLLQIIRKQLPSLRLDMWEARLFSGEDEPRQASEDPISQALLAC